MAGYGCRGQAHMVRNFQSIESPRFQAVQNLQPAFVADGLQLADSKLDWSEYFSIRVRIV